MIDITIMKNKQDNIQAFTVSGHANVAPHGYDIVCAAVSAVTIGFANVVIDKDFTYKPFLEAKEGYICLELDERVADYETVETLMEAMVHILNQIAVQYPDYVQLKEASLCLQT
jgi:uncharacterized protein YsxB (DUF464 family)